MRNPREQKVQITSHFLVTVAHHHHHRPSTSTGGHFLLAYNRVYAYDLHTRQNGNNSDDGGLRTALWLALVHCLGPLLASTGPGDRPGMIDSARFRFRGQSIAPILAWYLSLRPPPPVLTRYSLMTSWPHGPASHPHLNKTDTVLPTA